MITNLQDLEELIDSTVSIPTIPSLLVEINQVLASPDGSAQDAAEIIERDPALAAKALRLVNSSFYALNNPVSSISLACSILGLKVIRNLVLQTTVLDTFGDGPSVDAFNVSALWDHSFKTAMAARLLAEENTSAITLNSDDAYTAGLVHDVGKMVLLQGQPKRFGIALRASRESGFPLARAEMDTFGFCHAHVGGVLCERWKLSDHLRDAVMLHHDTDSEHEARMSGVLIAAANTIAHEAWGKADWQPTLLAAETIAALGISAERIEEIRSQVADVSMA